MPSKWQWDDVIRPFYGTVRPDGRRQYKRLTLELPRKNGKSTLAAGLGLYHLFADGEDYPEVVCGAGSRDQAAAVFESAKEFIAANPPLASRCIVRRTDILLKKGGYLKCIPADGKLQHGRDLSAVICDELHVWPNGELFEALTTSAGARRQPVEILISTAGHDKDSLWGGLISHAKAVMAAREAGNEIDPILLPVLYEAPENAPWDQEETWKIANPGYGVSVGAEYLMDKLAEARSTPAMEQSFRRLYLNQWTSSEIRWILPERWDACQAQMPDLRGKPCWAALDLSSSSDLTALVLAFPIGGKIWLLPYAWAPRAAMETRERSNKQRYDTWAANGHLTITEGERINYPKIREKINELRKLFNIKEICLDLWNAAQFAEQLRSEDNMEVVSFPMAKKFLAPAAKDFETQVIEKVIQHAGNPVHRWCVGNTMVTVDHQGFIMPSKKKSSEKIDLCVASIMSASRASMQQVTGRSIYQNRSLRVV